jgi:hypothetical protein
MNKARSIFTIGTLILVLPLWASANQNIICVAKDSKLGEISISLQVLQVNASCQMAKVSDCVPYGSGGQDGSWDCAESQPYDELICDGQIEAVQTVKIGGKIIVSQRIGSIRQSRSLPPNLKYSVSLGENETMPFRTPDQDLMRPNYQGLEATPDGKLKVVAASELRIIWTNSPFQSLPLNCHDLQ